MAAKRAKRGVAVLIVDNNQDVLQAADVLFKRHGLTVTPLVVELKRRNIERKAFPKDKVDRVLEVIRESGPQIVLVDICLYETPIDIADEKKATWSGPALMAAIRQEFPTQKMASYSAYTEYVMSEIDDQRRAYGVHDTPHWGLSDLNIEAVRAAIRS